jgi:protein-tyrosine phosphatase
MLKIVFVCLGNICRSPMAEGIFEKLVKERSLSDKISIDSAGTSAYHLGELPDQRMRATADNYSICLTHKARQFSLTDFETFDYIVAMDRENLKNIKRLEKELPVHHAKILLMRDFDPHKSVQDVPDPYYGGQKGFEEVYEILHRCGTKFLDHLIREHQLKS